MCFHKCGNVHMLYEDKTEAKGSYILTGPDANYPWVIESLKLVAFSHMVNMEAGMDNLWEKGLRSVFCVVGMFGFCPAPGLGHSLTVSSRLSI